MWEWIGQVAILVASALVPASDARAADGPNPLTGEWKGHWESAMTPHRGPVELDITSATATEATGTGMVGGVCGATMTFRGTIEDGKLIIQEDLGRPCGTTTLTLRQEGRSLRGNYRAAEEGGDVVLVKQ